MTESMNAEAIEAWNTVLFDKFVRFRHVVTSGLGEHGREVLRRHPVEAGQRVLDVGCGFGDTTLELSQAVGPRGEAVGVDAAPRFIDAAIREGAQAGVPNARFLVRDVQTEDLAGPYDRVYSRFGTMFFASPLAALRNIRRSLAPGALLTWVVWRRREDNAWLYEAERRVKALVDEPEERDAPTCGPGPFSMASADLASDLLVASKFDRPTFERFDTDICIGRDLNDAVEFAMTLGPAGEILRLAQGQAEVLKPKIVDALRDVLGHFVREDGVYAPSSTWIVSACAASV